MYRIAGMQKVTLVDYPGLVSAILFLQGCNFRCGYCYNPQTVIPAQYGPLLDNGEVCDFLTSRVGKLEGVVLSGGEPTIQGSDMIELLVGLKSLDFSVKIDTNGTRPEVLAEAIRLGVDYIAMDVKAPLKKYGALTGCWFDHSVITKSIALIMESGVPHEFRTTVCRGQLDCQDLVKIGRMVAGCDLLAFQKFQDMGGALIDPSLAGRGSLSDEEFALAQRELETVCKKVVVR